jgi:hypothetical protein
LEGGDNANDVINEIEQGQLILLDKLISGINREYGAVYENFEKDIYRTLKEALPQLNRYQTIKIIFPEYTYHAVEILKGFHFFCSEFAFNHKVVRHLEEEPVNEGEVFINLMEDDLVVLLEKIQGADLKIGKNIGVISYNETSLKRFVLDGITTISTDFKKMGEMAADLVLNNSKEHIEVPFALTLRNSL